ncbi:hypothetical protein PENTCL1PPCAC_22024, partial [Pristionchus entomophagus]
RPLLLTITLIALSSIECQDMRGEKVLLFSNSTCPETPWYFLCRCDDGSDEDLHSCGLTRDGMAVFTLHTNIKSDEISPDFLSQLSAKIAELLQITGNALIVHVIGDEKLAIGGKSEAPNGFASLDSYRSLKKSKLLAIRDFIARRLGITFDRLFIDTVKHQPIRRHKIMDAQTLNDKERLRIRTDAVL